MKYQIETIEYINEGGRRIKSSAIHIVDAESRSEALAVFRKLPGEVITDVVPLQD